MGLTPSQSVNQDKYEYSAFKTFDSKIISQQNYGSALELLKIIHPEYKKQQITPQLIFSSFKNAETLPKLFEDVKQKRYGNLIAITRLTNGLTIGGFTKLKNLTEKNKQISTSQLKSNEALLFSFTDKSLSFFYLNPLKQSFKIKSEYFEFGNKQLRFNLKNNGKDSSITDMLCANYGTSFKENTAKKFLGEEKPKYIIHSITGYQIYYLGKSQNVPHDPNQGLDLSKSITWSNSNSYGKLNQMNKPTTISPSQPNKQSVSFKPQNCHIKDNIYKDQTQTIDLANSMSSEPQKSTLLPNYSLKLYFEDETKKHYNIEQIVDKLNNYERALRKSPFEIKALKDQIQRLKEENKYLQGKADPKVTEILNMQDLLKEKTALRTKNQTIEAELKETKKQYQSIKQELDKIKKELQDKIKQQLNDQIKKQLDDKIKLQLEQNSKAEEQNKKQISSQQSEPKCETVCMSANQQDNERLANLQQKIASLSLEKQQLFYQNEKLKQMETVHSNQISTLNQLVQKIQSEKSKLSIQLQQSKNKQAEIQNELSQLSTKSSDEKAIFKQQLQASKISEQKLRQTIYIQNQQITTLSSQCTSKEGQNARLLKQVTEKEGQISQLQATNNALKKSEQRLQSQLQREKLNLSELQLKRKTLQQTKNQEIANLNQRIKDLEKQNSEFLNSQTTLKSTISSQQSSILKLSAQLQIKSEPEQKLFNGDILNLRQKKIVVKHINKKIISTRLIYKYDILFQNINIHKFLDGKSHILCVIKTKSNFIVAIYYEGTILNKGGSGQEKAWLISVNLDECFEARENTKQKSFKADENHIFFGNSEPRIKSGKNELYCNFDTAQSYFNPKNKKLIDVFGQKDRDMKNTLYEFHEILLDQQKVQKQRQREMEQSEGQRKMERIESRQRQQRQRQQ